MNKMIAKAAHHTCKAGYKCCDYDMRSHAEIRRSQRRRETQDWKREAYQYA